MKKGLLRKFLCVIISALMVSSLVSCSNSEPKSDGGLMPEKSSERNLDEIKKSGKLILGTNPEYPPFSFVQDADGKETVNGADVMLAKKIAEDIGVELEVKKLDYYQLLEELDAGNIDIVISSMKETEEGLKVAEFSTTYFPGTYSGTLAINKQNSDKFKSLDDVNTIGVQKGSADAMILKDSNIGKEIKEFNTMLEIKTALEDNSLDSAYVEFPKYQTLVLGSENIFSSINNIKLSDTNNYGQTAYSVAVKKGNSDLLKSVDQIIIDGSSNNDYNKFLKEAQELSNIYQILGENPQV